MSGPSSTALQPQAKRSALVGTALLLVSGGIFYQVLTAKDAASIEAEKAEAAMAQAAREREALKQKMGQFIHSEAKPMLEETKAKDEAALQKALASVDQIFAAYASGIPKFSSDLTAWGTRFKILWRKSVETVEGKDEHTWTQQLVQEKFGKHVMSDQRLEEDLLAVLKQFAFDLEASRNELISGLETQLKTADLPINIKDAMLRDFKGGFDGRVKNLLDKMPSHSLVIGVGSITAGIVAEEAVRQIVRAVVAQLAARLAATAAASGGAAGGAAAAGAGGGTAVAPGVGTVIGLAGGFIVGAVVDWWMTDEFKEEVGKQCQEFLDTTKTSLLHGDTALKAGLEAEIKRASAAYEAAIDESFQPPLP